MDNKICTNPVLCKYQAGSLLDFTKKNCFIGKGLRLKHHPSLPWCPEIPFTVLDSLLNIRPTGKLADYPAMSFSLYVDIAGSGDPLYVAELCKWRSYG